MAGSGKVLNLESLGNYVGEYTPPTLDGYVFAGWYTDPAPVGSTGNGTNGNLPPADSQTLPPFDISNPPLYGGTGEVVKSITVREDVTYYAGWRPEPKSFKSSWIVGSNGHSLALRINATFSGNLWVDWGDGTPLERRTSSSVQHTYATAGTYQVKIYGDLKSFTNGGSTSSSTNY